MLTHTDSHIQGMQHHSGLAQKLFVLEPL